MSDELSFSSKTDLWLLILVLLVPASCLWIMAETVPDMSTVDWLLAVPLALGIALPLWIIGSLRYFLSDEVLRIRCGPFHWRIPIQEIDEIEATQSLLSSPAMSLDRLRIRWADGRSVMIAPEPRKEFLRQLEFRRKQAPA